MFSINKINEFNKSEFLSVFGNIFEKTEWIAKKAFELKPFKNFEDFFSKFTEIYEISDKEKILKILNAHPDLAVEKKLTKDSAREQLGANLNECAEEEFFEFSKLFELSEFFAPISLSKNTPRGTTINADREFHQTEAMAPLELGR